MSWTSMNWNLHMNKNQWVSVCSELVYKYDRDRMMCISLAPIEKRELLLAILAFNHEISIIPELVREPLLGEIRIQWWTDSLISIYKGEKPEHPVALGLSAAIQTCGLSKCLFDHFLVNRSFDLKRSRPATLDDLEIYARGTSGALHELMAEVLVDKPNKKVRNAASNAGTAWALVGLLRAIPFHESQGRSYLPSNMNSDAGIVAVAKAAERCIYEARSVRQHVPYSLLPVMLPITLVEYNLRKLIRCGYDPEVFNLRGPGVGRLLSFYWKALRKRY